MGLPKLKELQMIKRKSIIVVISCALHKMLYYGLVDIWIEQCCKYANGVQRKRSLDDAGVV